MAELPTKRDLGAALIPSPVRDVPHLNLSGLERGARIAAESPIAAGLQNIVGMLVKQADEERALKDQLAMTQARSQWIAADVKTRATLDENPDYTTYQDTYKQTMTQAREEILKGLPKHLHGQFSAEIIDDQAKGEVAVYGKARTKWTQAQLGQIEQAGMEYRRLAGSPDMTADAREKLIVDYGTMLETARDLGILKPEDVVKRKREFATDIASSEISAWFRDQPDPYSAALKLYNGTVGDESVQASLDMLSEEDRTKISNAVIDRYTKVWSLGNRQREEAERRAEKEMAAAADDMLKNVYAELATGQQPTVDELIKLRTMPGVTPAEYNGVLTAMAGGAKEDDPNFISEIMPKLHEEDLTLELTAGLQTRQLTVPSYISLIGKNKAALKDDRPASPYKSGRDFLSTGLDPGQLGGDPYTRQALSIARANALEDYDTFVEKHPEITRDEAVQKANDLVQQYQVISYGNMRMALRRPRGFNGSKNEVTLDVIKAARNSLERDIIEGRISNEEAVREIESLNTWEAVLAKTK